MDLGEAFELLGAEKMLYHIGQSRKKCVACTCNEQATTVHVH